MTVTFRSKVSIIPACEFFSTIKNPQGLDNHFRVLGEQAEEIRVPTH